MAAKGSGRERVVLTVIFDSLSEGDGWKTVFSVREY